MSRKARMLAVKTKSVANDSGKISRAISGLTPFSISLL